MADVIVTVGPASATPELLQEFVAAGASAFRLNASHLRPGDWPTWHQRFDAAFGADWPVPVFLDLQGGKWRLGDFLPFDLVRGATVVFRCAENARDPATLPVPHDDFFLTLRNSILNGQAPSILLNDARYRLTGTACAGSDILAVVETGGWIESHKGVTSDAADIRCESLSTHDREVIEAAAAQPMIGFALSYLRDGREFRQLRRCLPLNRPVVAKLERPEALAAAADLAGQANSLWVCRGDLGAELGLIPMARAVRAYTKKIRELGCQTMLAGQVLEHMTKHAQPTRSEICHLYDAICQGFAGVVLSDETAIGDNPAAACRMAVAICRAASRDTTF